MSESRIPSKLYRVVGWLLIVVGVAAIGIRMQQIGPLAFSSDRNLVVGGLTLLLGGWLVTPWLARHRLVAPLAWVALAASPIMLFLALYATLAEVEEVVVLRATDQAGRPSDLRLWVVDHGDSAWVTMPRSKADAHGLSETRVELMRGGEVGCVIATRHEDRATVNEIHQVRHKKYGVQRLATSLGLFGRSADEDVVALRLDACPGV